MMNDEQLERVCFYEPALRKHMRFMQWTFYLFLLMLMVFWVLAICSLYFVEKNENADGVLHYEVLYYDEIGSKEGL